VKGNFVLKTLKKNFKPAARFLGTGNRATGEGSNQPLGTVKCRLYIKQQVAPDYKDILQPS
jgi:hypothetical protein